MSPLISVPPIVRYMILCDEMLPDPQRPGKPLIVGLTTVLSPPMVPPYPFKLDRICVFLVLTDGRGSDDAWIRIVEDVTNAKISETAHRRIQMTMQPMRIQGLTWYVHGMPFPQSGFYRFEFWYNNQCLSTQVLHCR